MLCILIMAKFCKKLNILVFKNCWIQKVVLIKDLNSCVIKIKMQGYCDLFMEKKFPLGFNQKQLYNRLKTYITPVHWLVQDLSNQMITLCGMPHNFNVTSWSSYSYSVNSLTSGALKSLPVSYVHEQRWISTSYKAMNGWIVWYNKESELDYHWRCSCLFLLHTGMLEVIWTPLVWVQGVAKGIECWIIK